MGRLVQLNSVSKLSPSGTLGNYAVGSQPVGIAFDGTNMWVTNSNGNSVTELSPCGETIGTYLTGNSPESIAFDGTNMWVVDIDVTPSPSCRRPAR